ncbi:hypothetical protein BGZ94_005927 [Podila epigama]|nr:hypothetical protein BGZ94_005927 [Podila epigama]
MKRLPLLKGLLNEQQNGRSKSNRVSPLHQLAEDNNNKLSRRSSTSSCTSTATTTRSIVPDAAPSLPPLFFDTEANASTSSFDLGDLLLHDATVTQQSSAPSSPSSSPAVTELTSSRPIDAVATPRRRSPLGARPSIDRRSTIHEAQFSRRPLGATPPPSSLRYQNQPVDSIPKPLAKNEVNKNDTTRVRNAESMIQELRMELAKYNPMSPLLHGAPQQEYGLLLEKKEQMNRQLAELKSTLQGLHVQKDLMVMDLDAMENSLRGKEQVMSEEGASLPRNNTEHVLMKQTYLSQVKDLQDQQTKLREEIESLKSQRDGLLNEMHILSVRNSELTAMNNTIANENLEQLQRQRPVNPVQGLNASFTEKLRRPRHSVAGPAMSTVLFSSPMSGSESDPLSLLPHNPAFNREKNNECEMSSSTATKKNLRRRYSTMKQASSSVGAMFGKLVSETLPGSDTGTATATVGEPNPGNNLDIPNEQQQQQQGQQGQQTFRARLNSLVGESLEGRSSGPHYFLPHNYVRPVRCQGCDDMIWGREFKCQYCGYQSHNKCTQYAFVDCRRSSSETSRSDPTNLDSNSTAPSQATINPVHHIMFGSDLQEQLQHEGRTTVPLVVEQCIRAVDERGLEVEGIYRKSGMAAEARKLVEAFNQDQMPDLLDEKVCQDISSITTVFKQYLRSLPEPLIPDGLYKEFMTAAVTESAAEEEKLQTVRELIQRMPSAQYRTMKALMAHLGRVTKHTDVNRMNAKNLSVVFGPTLMRHPDMNQEMADVTFRNLTIEFLIQHADDLFVDEDTSQLSQDHE